MGAIFAGLLLRAVNVATPASTSATTSNVSALLDTGIAPVAGLVLLLLGLGAFVSLTFGRGF